MRKSCRFLFLTLAIGIIIFDEVFSIIFFQYVAPYLEEVYADPNFSATIISIIETVILFMIYNTVFKKKNYLKDFDKNYERSKLKIHEIIIIGMGFIGIVSIWFIFVDLFLGDIPAVEESLDYFTDVFDPKYNPSFILDLISGSLMAAIMEELLFRGIVHNSLKLFSESRAFSIIATGILFGIWHGILVQSVYTAFGGIIFSYVYERTGNLIYPMAVHFVNNFLSTMSIELDNHITNFDDNFTAICIGMIPVMLYYLFKIRNKSKEKEYIIN